MATYTGTNGDDTLTGTSAADSFDPKLGRDIVAGGGGNDTLTVNYAQQLASGSDQLIGKGSDGSFTGSLSSSGNVISYSGIHNLTYTASSGDDVVRVDASPLLNGDTLAVDGGGGTNTLFLDASALASTKFQVGSNGSTTSNVGSYGNFAIYSIVAGGGANTIVGGNAGNTITSAGSNDVLSGGDGNDTITFNGGDAKIYGKGGNNTINATGNKLTITAGGGAQNITAVGKTLDITASGARGNVIDATGDAINITLPSGGTFVTTTGGKATIHGSVADLTTIGTIVQDADYVAKWHADYSATSTALTYDFATNALSNGTMLNKAGLVDLKLGSGDDIANFGGNNTYLSSISLDGGSGNDTINYDYPAPSTKPSPNQSPTNFSFHQGHLDGTTSIENVNIAAQAGQYAPVYAVTEDGPLALGSSLNVDAANLSALVVNFTGSDPITWETSTSGVVNTGGHGNFTNLATYSVHGGTGNDRLTGTGSFYGGDGDDTLQGLKTAGILTLDGGAGNDTALYTRAAAAVTVSLATTTKQNTHGAGYQIIENIENLQGSDYNDTLTGDTHDNVLRGGLGDDVLNGGAGIDTAKYAGEAAGVTVDLSLTGPQDTGGAGHDTLISIENLIGTAYDDMLRGNAGDNVLDGGPGNNLLHGGDGGDDTVTYARATTGVHVSLLLQGSAQATGYGNDTLVGISNLIGAAGDDTLVGSSGDNALTGGDGNDTLNGGDGDDVLAGGAGNDRLDGGSGINGVTYADAVAGVSVDLSATQAQDTGGAGTDTILHVRNVTGSAFADHLTGNSAANFINGGAGADVMTGGAGDDTYVVDNVGDHVVEAADGGNDTVRTTLASYVLSANVENLIYIGAASFHGTGNDGSNVISGGAGNDVLDGGAGGDVASYENAAAAVTVSLALQGSSQNTVGAGSDTLTNFENLQGSIFGDTLTGDGNKNVLRGDAGDDMLNGGGGNDLLIGAAGADTMTGGAGADTFMFTTIADFATGTARDTITDFSHAERDHIDLSAIDPDPAIAGKQSFTYVGAAAFRGPGTTDYEIRAQQNGDGSYTVEGDVNHDGHADFAFTVMTGAPLVASDFVL